MEKFLDKLQISYKFKNFITVKRNFFKTERVATVLTKAKPYYGAVEFFLHQRPSSVLRATVFIRQTI